MNVLKYLIYTTIFSGLYLISTYSHEYHQPQSHNTAHTQHYEQRSNQSRIKLSGWPALIPACIDMLIWLLDKEETVPQEPPVEPYHNENIAQQPHEPQDNPRSGLRWHYDENNTFCAWTKREDRNYFDELPRISPSESPLVKADQACAEQPKTAEPPTREKDTQAYFEDMKAQARGISVNAFVTHICRIASDNKKLHLIFEKYNHRFQRSQTQEQKSVLAYIDKGKTPGEDIDHILQAYFRNVDTSAIRNNVCLRAQKQAIRKEQWLADTNKSYFCIQCRDIRSKEVKAYTKLHDQQLTRISHCHGATRQCMLHGELGDIIKAAATIYARTGDNPCIILATQCAQAGMLLNKMEDFVAAFCMADMGWALIDMVHDTQDGIDTRTCAQELRTYFFQYEPCHENEVFYHAAATRVMAFIADYPECADFYMSDKKEYKKKINMHIQQLQSLEMPKITDVTIRACAHHAVQKLVKTRIQEFAAAMTHDQYLKKTYIQNISRRNHERPAQHSRSRRNAHNTPASPEEPDPDDDDDLLKEFKKLIAREIDDATLELQQALDAGDIEQAQKYAQALGWNEDLTPLYAETDTDGIPVICKHDPLLKILSDEQKRELLATNKQKFIALLIKRDAQKHALIKKLTLEELVIKYPDVHDFLYELLYLSDEDIAKRIIDLAHELQFMEDGPRKEALQALVDFFMKSKHSDSLSQTFDQYDQEKDMVDDDTHLAQSRAQRRKDIENAPSSSEITTQSYELSSWLQNLLNLLEIGQSQFKECTGNGAQQAIHRSIVQSLEDMDTSDDGLSWNSPLHILAAQLAKLGITLNLLQDFDGSMLMADVTAGLVDIRNGIGRAAYREATDVFGWLMSLGFAGISLYATPNISAGISALCLIWFIGNIVWQVGHLGYESQYDRKTYDAKIEAIQAITLGDAAELIASFVFSFARDHFVQGALRSFVSAILKNPAFIKQLNSFIDQQIKKTPPKPPKKPKVPKKQKKIQKPNPPKKKLNKAPKTKPNNTPKLPKNKGLGRKKRAVRKMARRRQLQNKRQKNSKQQGAQETKTTTPSEEGSHQSKEKAKPKKPFERQLQGAKPKLTQELKRRMEEAFKKLLEQYKDKIDPRIRDHIKGINLEHHFYPDSRKGSLTGYHNETFVEAQIAKLIGKGKEGAKEARWAAKVGDQLKTKVSTIDPPHWGPLKTIEKVIEGMQNVIKEPFSIRGGIQFEGMTTEGFKISYYVDKNGIIQTFFIMAYEDRKWIL